jgi:hypothetical protein
VFGPNGKDSINKYYPESLGKLADEHSTIIPPGTIPGHDRDYLFFITGFVLAGDLVPDGKGIWVPDGKGQMIWKLDFAKDYGDETNRRLFFPPLRHHCPPSGDPTFDLNYACNGSVVIDPTNPGPEELLMIYEGTNKCIGVGEISKIPLEINDKVPFYATIGVATSADYGRLWPFYRNNYSSDTLGPMAPEMGAFWPLVCAGNKNCVPCGPLNICDPPRFNFGRYPVLMPSFTLKKAYATGKPLSGNMGYQALSAFVDDVHANSGNTKQHDIYVYAVQNFGCDKRHCPHTENGLTVSRARLKRGAVPLEFMNWYDNSFEKSSKPYPHKGVVLNPGCEDITNAGLGSNCGGLLSPITFPLESAGASNKALCKACLLPQGPVGKSHQRRQMGSISYVPETKQYLLIFLCLSQSDPDPTFSTPKKQYPETRLPLPERGVALFYSTLDATQYDLSNQDKWSNPKEVEGSWEWSTSNNTGDPPSDCVDSLWYPSFMSLKMKPGYLSTRGYVFSMSGCLGGSAGRPRVYMSREFIIDVSSQ